jgi:hypothetical protein
VAYLQIQQDDDKTVTQAKWEEVKDIYCEIVYKYVRVYRNTLLGRRGEEKQKGRVYTTHVLRYRCVGAV